jgi:hypothetical protein
MAFLWRSGARDEPDATSALSKSQAYGPRAATTLIFLVGALYLVLLTMTAKADLTSRHN